MRIHLTGVSGTGMGSLAVLLRSAGHNVSGSDTRFDPPIGPMLRDANITCLTGYEAKHISPGLDLIVIGNVIRRDNVEAVAAASSGVRTISMSAAIRELFLTGRTPLVVAGTHGKTTTSAMCAWILESADEKPGWFIGGLPKNLKTASAIGTRERRLLMSGGGVGKAPFVVEGDEYDAVYWHKKAKFFDYIGVSDYDVAIVTSIEHDHIDIYPDVERYEEAFAEFIAKVPEKGALVVDAHDARARTLAQKHAHTNVIFYALNGDDTGDVSPTWMAAPVPIGDDGAQPFDVYAGGMFCGRFSIRVPGEHNVRNAMAALAACAEGLNVPIRKAQAALASFEGVRRRQDLIGEPGGIRVYDDFAHHPTAVDETLRALRSRHPSGKLFAVFEPRSATACRNIHQAAYASAFARADRILLAPLGRSNVATEERLDLSRLVHDLGSRATNPESVDAIIRDLAAEAKPGDTIALLSNGAFGGIHARLLRTLGEN